MNEITTLQISEFVTLIVTALFFLNIKKLKVKIGVTFFMIIGLMLFFLNYYFFKNLHEAGIEMFLFPKLLFFYLMGLQLVVLLWRLFFKK